MVLRKYDNFRKKLYVIIFRSDTRSGKYFDIMLLIMIVLSILCVFLESVASIRVRYRSIIYFIEWFMTLCFTVEYALRLYSVYEPKRYAWSFYGVIDLLAILPTYLSIFVAGTQYLVVIRALRLLRVFRILKLSRFLSEGQILRTALRGSFYKITVFLTSVIALVTIVGTLMYVIEGEQNGFTSIPMAIYWAIVTVTTVGYGDVSPQTPIGQLLASLLMVIGYGVIAVPTGIVSVEMAKASENGLGQCPTCGQRATRLDARYCAHCGNPLDKLHQVDL